MGFAAKEIRTAEPASTEALHSLLHVINNEVRASNASPPVPDENGKLGLEQLIEVLMLTRDAINEQIKGASNMIAQIARYSEVENAYQSEKRAVLQLREERDSWKERALMVTSWVKNS
ncbi:MAG TPA: hypothetical protein VHD34_03950 [Xanthobacteraceae bacterium]|nr:hypothetical protein [Xanthobacteraceae bacterium]